MDHTTARSPARARVLAFRGHGPRNERRHGNARARLRLLRDLPGARAGPDRLRACPGDGRAGREPGVRRAPSRAPAVALVARPVAVITGRPAGSAWRGHASSLRRTGWRCSTATRKVP